MYIGAHGAHGALGDAQLTVTGKAHLGESTVDAMQREFWEETGMKVRDFKKVCITSNFKNGATRYTGVVRITDCEFTASHIPTPPTGEDYAHRVEIAVVGTLAEFQHILSQVDERSKIEAKIAGVVLTRFDHFCAAYTWDCPCPAFGPVSPLSLSTFVPVPPLSLLHYSLYRVSTTLFINHHLLLPHRKKF